MVRRNLRHCWMIALVLLAFVLPAAAQDGVLQGSVKDAKGAPVEGAKVMIELAGSGRPKEAKTDKNGEFLQSGLLSGQYAISVSKEGIGQAKRTVAVRRGARNNYDMVLATGADTAGAAMAKVFDEGVAASVAGKPDEAIAKFQAAIAISANCADCYFNIGIAAGDKKDLAAAEAAYRKAIEIKPTFGDAYSSLGVILFNQGKTAEAKTMFEQAVANSPNDGDSHYMLGMTLAGSDPAKAVTEFETYLKLAPEGKNAALAKQFVGALKK